MYVVRLVGNYAVVKTAFGSLKCLFCSNAEKCKHIVHLNKVLESNDNDDLCLNQIFDEVNNLNTAKPYHLKCLSTKKVPFSLGGSLVSKITKKLDELYQEVDGVLQVYPEDVDMCTSCGFHAASQFEAMEKSIFVLTRYECRKAQGKK